MENPIAAQDPLRYSGISTIPGYKGNNDAYFSGMSTIEGDFEANIVKVSGKATCLGDMRIADRLKVSGMSTIYGNLEVQGSAQVSGSMKVEGPIRVGNQIMITGMLRTHKHLTAGEFIKNTGMLNVTGDLIALNTLKNTGKLSVKGSVKGSNINLWSPRPTMKIKFLERIAQNYIGGDLIANVYVKVSHTQIEGNLVAYSAHIGKNVKVNGEIYYVNSLTYEDGVSFKREPIKITPGEFPQVELPQSEIKQLLPKTDSQDSMRFCDQCGQGLSNANKFCPFCGNHLLIE